MAILLDNRDERFHVLEPEQPLLAERLVLDFKLIVAATVEYLAWWLRSNPESRVAVLRAPYRDHLTQRFTNYFSRIALP